MQAPVIPVKMITYCRDIFFGTYHGVAYAGMPNKEIYSLVVTYSSGYNSLAYNLFSPVSQKTMRVGPGELEVIEVTPDYLAFRFNG